MPNRHDSRVFDENTVSYGFINKRLDSNQKAQQRAALADRRDKWHKKNINNATGSETAELLGGYAGTLGGAVGAAGYGASAADDLLESRNKRFVKPENVTRAYKLSAAKKAGIAGISAGIGAAGISAMVHADKRRKKRIGGWPVKSDVNKNYASSAFGVEHPETVIKSFAGSTLGIMTAGATKAATLKPKVKPAIKSFAAKPTTKVGAAGAGGFGLGLGAGNSYQRRKNNWIK